jgi:hypothetical protein
MQGPYCALEIGRRSPCRQVIVGLPQLTILQRRPAELVVIVYPAVTRRVETIVAGSRNPALNIIVAFVAFSHFCRRTSIPRQSTTGFRYKLQSIKKGGCRRQLSLCTARNPEVSDDKKISGAADATFPARRAGVGRRVWRPARAKDGQAAPSIAALSPTRRATGHPLGFGRRAFLVLPRPFANPRHKPTAAKNIIFMREYLAVPARLELATFGLGNRCSIRLSYGTNSTAHAQAWSISRLVGSGNAPDLFVVACPFRKTSFHPSGQSPRARFSGTCSKSCSALYSIRRRLRTSVLCGPPAELEAILSLVLSAPVRLFSPVLLGPKYCTHWLALKTDEANALTPSRRR